MENKKRKEFMKKLAIQVEDIARKKLITEYEEMKPGIGEIVNGYKGFIYDLGGGFLDVVERYNECLQMQKKSKGKELIGDVKLKARIKDFSSSKTNTEQKILDDVFGMELVTQTELQKETLMLFNHLMFKINKDKKYNKTTGYVAYHCMGDFLPIEELTKEELKERIKQIIEQTKTKEYRYSKSEPNYSDKRNLTPVFPKLTEYISNGTNLDGLTEVLKELVDHMRGLKKEKGETPEIEFHFLTAEKEQEALKGTKANHANYKKVNQKLIEEYFLKGRLIRGINAPWKFVGTEDGVKLQDFYDTLIENWAFLEDEIELKKSLGQESADKTVTSKFDVLTASQFPFFRKYLDGEYKYPEEQNAEKWGVLKALIIANRMDRTENAQSIEEGLTIGIDQIW